MTQKLYEQDPMLQKFTAQVLSCRPEGGGFAAVLDQTAFYPEGGGQSADWGFLGGARVTDVQEQDGIIVHQMDRPLPEGERVEGAIDWERRFDHMQQHSGEHILSGLLCRMYHCDNVGFHLGAETVSIDYNVSITWEQALAAEEAANRVLWEDRAVEVSYPTRQELEGLDYRSKKEIAGQVRIVTFPGADCCACCGTHVLRAGQVGVIKILSCQKFRQGVRLEILCGQRAYRYLAAVCGEAQEAARRLSVKPVSLSDAVERRLEELKQERLRRSRAEEAAAAALAEQYAGTGDVLLIRPAMEPEALRKLSGAVAERAGGRAAVFAGPVEGRFHYALTAAPGEELTGLVKALNAALQGRGGGWGAVAQGSVLAGEEEIQTFFQNWPGQAEESP